ncbi:hypothetical protein ACWGHM_03885 [Streptomyces sp. NPDC054904]|uniref:hypothetical protein n=1 Tax=unclassified Streptomyces TaxID=2593676 RepID=UPI0029AC9012|nr:hypothetical protein [Streptomyces sp. DK15]MDX2388643.1 hypothetical protein [Streptomyces sp. DK15]
MTATGRICAHCQRALGADFETVIGHSMSGARPDQYRHWANDPRCRPITEVERERGY